MDWSLTPLATDVRWAYPLVLLALAALPTFWVRRRRQERLDVVTFTPLQYGGNPGARRIWSLTAHVTELTIAALLLVGLAGPYRSSTTELIEDVGIDVVLVLDVSLSMLAEDLQPNRLAALRRIASDFLDRRGADRVALVIFAKDTYVQAPLTTDDLVLRELLEGVTIYGLNQYLSGGTAIGDALLVAADQLAQARVEDRDQSIILITDGESNLGVDPKLAARYLRELEIDFHAIGVGSTEPIEVFAPGARDADPVYTRLDEKALEHLVEIAGGRYHRAQDTDELEQVFLDLARLQSSPLELQTIERRRSLAPPVAMIALFLFGAYVTLSAVVLRRPLR